MQALSSHYEIYKRVFLHPLMVYPLMVSKLLLVVRAGGGDDDLLRRGVQKHIADSQLAFGRHVLERHRHHIGCAIGAGRQISHSGLQQLRHIFIQHNSVLLAF